MFFCAYMHSYVVLQDNTHISSWKSGFLYCTDNRTEENIKNMYVYLNIFSVIYNYLYLKVMLWDSEELCYLSGNLTNVLFSKAVTMPAFEDVRTTGCIPISTTVFPVFSNLYMVLMLDIFAWFQGKWRERKGYWERNLATSMQIQVQIPEGKNEKPHVLLQVRMGIKHMCLSYSAPFLFTKQI